MTDWPGARPLSGFERGRVDECNRDQRRSAGGGRCDPVGLVLLQDAAAEATDGGLCIAKNVSGLRVDHATVQGSLPGVRESLCERSGGATGSKTLVLRFAQGKADESARRARAVIV
jgi:hypothetical protein